MALNKISNPVSLKSVDVYEDFVTRNVKYDLCPVCWEPVGLRTRHECCSERCKREAVYYKSLFRKNSVRLSVLGFPVKFQEIYIPEITVPEYLQEFYPGTNQRFYPLPLRPYKLKVAILMDFWDGIKRELGATVCHAITELRFSNSQNVLELRAEFKEMLKDRMFLDQDVFICPDCGGKYFDGELTRTKFQRTCCELKQAAFPF